MARREGSSAQRVRELVTSILLPNLMSPHMQNPEAGMYFHFRANIWLPYIVSARNITDTEARPRERPKMRPIIVVRKRYGSGCKVKNSMSDALHHWVAGQPSKVQNLRLA